MKILKSFLGYTWASLAILVVFVTFVGSEPLSRVFASATGITVSPRITGGKVIQTVEHGTYRTMVYRPVFDGLLGERSAGFVQVEWEPQGVLPPVLEEKIELRKERGIAFVVRLDTRTGAATVQGLQGKVTGIDRVYHLDKGWAVRVAVEKAG
jgi:hypothetical protein